MVKNDLRLQGIIRWAGSYKEISEYIWKVFNLNFKLASERNREKSTDTYNVNVNHDPLIVTTMSPITNQSNLFPISSPRTLPSLNLIFLIWQILLRVKGKQTEATRLLCCFFNLASSAYYQFSRLMLFLQLLISFPN